ncbi:MAG: epimerase [Planctomycetota bacterium]
MKIVIPGGSGQVGAMLVRALAADGIETVVVCRHPPMAPPGVMPALSSVNAPAAQPARFVHWDGRTVEEWAREIDGAAAVINLAGRSVNCRYTAANLKQMLDSRVESTRAVGIAIAQARRPPPVWLQMSTATIYAHRFDAPNDEIAGEMGGAEPGVPAYWKTSVDIATAWERALLEADTPDTRRVALRSAMVMSPDRGGIFDVLCGLTRKGLGGAVAGGRQYVSWIHERDFCRAVRMILERSNIAGPVNLAAPEPLPQREFMAALRAALGVRIGLPATAWMAKMGAVFLRTDAELLLKSRRVVSQRLTAAGFDFDFPAWPAAAHDLAERRRKLLV